MLKMLKKISFLVTVLAICVMGSSTVFADTDTEILHVSQKEGVSVMSSTMTSTPNGITASVEEAIAQTGKTAVGPGEEKRFFKGSEIMMLTNKTDSQMMSFVITDSKGQVIVVDGGLDADAGHLLETIKAKGGHVSAWFITHPHSDHIGALNSILRNSADQITIDHIYYSFADLPWYYENEPSRADMVKELLDTFATLPQEKLHGDIQKGQVIQVGEIKVTVMNKPYLSSTNSINNSSVVYKMEIDGKKVMFLGDMGKEVCSQFLADYANTDLKCDIVQMAHHGQYGVTEEFYQRLKPEACMWPTPGWLWDNDGGNGYNSGSWYTLDTRRWIKQIGAKYNYCIKDGDQVIR